jgi:hypothetical protein
VLGIQRNFEAPLLCLPFPWQRYFTFYRNFELTFREKRLISLNRLAENSNLEIFYSKPGCHVVSKAFSISKSSAAMDMLKLRVTWSLRLIHCSVMLLCVRKPNWLALNRPLFAICLHTIFRITFSNNLPVMDRRLIGHRFGGNLGSLPGFSKVITFASKTLENVKAECSD